MVIWLVESWEIAGNLKRLLEKGLQPALGESLGAGHVAAPLQAR